MGLVVVYPQKTHTMTEQTKMIRRQLSKAEQFTGWRMRVWDFPTRAFHWALVLLIAWEWLSSDLGGGWMTYHMWGGYAVLCLVLFRVLWGFMGSTTARFSAFIRSPRRVWQYITGRGAESGHDGYGHNPLGGLSVVAFLVSLSVQVTTGLFATDDILTQGPLNPLVRNRTADFLTSIHKVNFDILLGLISVHILAVLAHRIIGGKNLVGPMITGYTDGSAVKRARHIVFARAWVGVLALSLSGIITWLIVRS